MGFKNLEPLMCSGRVPLFFLKVAPNSLSGLIILFISLFFNEESPVILIVLGEFIKVAVINLAVVPEFPASKVKLSL